MALDPSFFVAGAITGGVAFIASLLSLVLGVKSGPPGGGVDASPSTGPAGGSHAARGARGPTAHSPPTPPTHPATRPLPLPPPTHPPGHPPPPPPPDYMLAHRKLSLEEESKQAEVKRLVDKYRNPLVIAAQELSNRLYNAMASVKGGWGVFWGGARVRAGAGGLTAAASPRPARRPSCRTWTSSCVSGGVGEGGSEWDQGVGPAGAEREEGWEGPPAAQRAEWRRPTAPALPHTYA
jgi:hypothetical protein